MIFYPKVYFIVNNLESPDIFCMNETRVSVEYLEKNNILEQYFPNYYSYWNTSMTIKGYSGVSIISKIKPIDYFYGIENETHDAEGRVVTLEYKDFFLVSVYVPNSGNVLKRLDYRVQQWDINFHDYLKKLKRTKNVIVAGDLNVAHQKIDVWESKNRQFSAGFTNLERLSFQQLLDSGFIDTYRYLYPDKREYTYWDNYGNARLENKGWRIDYFLANGLNDRLKDSQILDRYYGSDHCPIKLSLL